MAKTEATTEPGKTAPPYIAFSTLKTMSGNLKVHGLPPRIDKSIMSNFSGAVASQLMTALRFLDLINADETPTPRLKSLVAAFDTPLWQSELQAVLKHAYPAIFKIDLATASPKLLYETFESAYAGGGETVRKTVTFFLNAAAEAGIQVSPYIMKNKKPRSGIGKRRNGRSAPRATTRARDRQDEEPENEVDFVSPKSERSPYEVLMHDIYDPKAMGPDEEKAVFTLARYLKKKETA